MPCAQIASRQVHQMSKANKKWTKKGSKLLMTAVVPPIIALYCHPQQLQHQKMMHW